MKMPNFLIIGAAKAGATALYEYLKQHPQIYMSHENNQSSLHFKVKSKIFADRMIKKT